MKNHNGFSLVEVLVFTSIISIVFVTASAVTTASVRNMKINEHKILATHYAEELMQWIRNEKEADWKVFVQRDNATYCFNDASLAWPGPGACASYNSPGLTPNIYKREAVIQDASGADEPRFVEVTVSWLELGRNTPYVVRLNTTLSLWE